MKQIIKNLTELDDFAESLTKQKLAGQIIGLIGNLGAGKTTLVQLIAIHLGVTDIVNSPTFVLQKNYQVPSGEIKQILHLDGYRLNNYEELEDLGILEQAKMPTNVTFIEWADKFPELKKLPNYQEIKIRILDDEQREIEN